MDKWAIAITLTVGIMVGIGIGEIIGVQEGRNQIQQEAIENNVAKYVLVSEQSTETIYT